MIKNVLFFGSDRFSVHCLRSLIQSAPTLKITCAYTKATSDFARHSCHNNLPSCILPKKLLGWKLHDDFDLGLIASFGSFVPLALMQQFEAKTILNAHPSLLPLYRGAAPIQRSLMDDIEQTGVTIIDCESKEFDAGNIWRQTRFAVRDRTHDQIVEYSGELAGRMFAEIIIDFDGCKEGRKRQEGVVTIANKIIKADALVNFDQMSTRKVYCLYKAIGHQENLYSFLSGCLLTLYSIKFNMPKPLNTQYELDKWNRVLHIRCGDGLSIACDSFGISGKSNRFTALDIHNHLINKH